jgi:YidC/Oxa1 family membrane protein insertase
MDKKSLLGFVMIGIVFIAWIVYNSYHTQHLEPPKPQDTTDVKTLPPDDISHSDKDTELIEKEEEFELDKAVPEEKDSLLVYRRYGKDFAPFVGGDEKVIIVENDLVKAYISSKGATITKWWLKDYKQWNGYQTQLIWNDGGELFLKFSLREDKQSLIDTRDLRFNFDTDKSYFKLTGSDTLVLTATLEPSKGRSIVRTYKFYGDKYIVDTDIIFNNMESIVHPRGYYLMWTDGLKYQEQSSVDESYDAEALISMNNELFYLDADETELQKQSVVGAVDYAAVKTKYFTAAIIPHNHTFDGTVEISGYMQQVRNEGVVERYNMSYHFPYKGGYQENGFRVYIGPLDYDKVSAYGIEATVNFGWRWLIRPIGEYFMLPFFKLIYGFIFNYGISIMIFAILMKIILYPLSIQQMRSAHKMKLIAPEMEKMREKYKDDNKKQQQEMMKLYSEYGINPAGGCLPLLLQMPILYSMWSVLRTSIDLRQADFIWWITDLSLPDTIVTFPVAILGIKHISGLALLMGVTLFFQQKLTITDPRQKALVYMMPIMFTLMFSNFPAGLNLYYFMFNLLGIIQQIYINKFSRKRLTLEDLKKMPKKEGWIQKKMKQAQEIAESQGKSAPNAPYQNTKSKYARKKKKK